MNVRRADAHKPEYMIHTIGRVVFHGREVNDNRYTLICKCGFMDTLLRPKKQQRAIYKQHLLDTVGHL